MRVIIQPDRESASIYAAQLIAEAIKHKPNLVLGLATGNTPCHIYQHLIAMNLAGKLSFTQVQTFNLDEYYGLSTDDPRSYHYFMQQKLFANVDIPPVNIHIPDGTVPPQDLRTYCRQYESDIRDCGGIDLQLLGIGMDGHIGFNEPGSSLASRTRVKTLCRSTKMQNAADFGSEENVPDLALTMGIGTIMEARAILLLAFGQSKSYILSEALEGPVTSWVPASILQMHHKLKVIVDEEAANRLRLYDYYKHVEKMRLKYGFANPGYIDREDLE